MEALLLHSEVQRAGGAPQQALAAALAARRRAAALKLDGATAEASVAAAAAWLALGASIIMLSEHPVVSLLFDLK